MAGKRKPIEHFTSTEIPRRTCKGRIGIIAGSGPEAGVDLWAKIIDAAKRLLGKNYHGDLDAPEVTVFSVPELGLSMELEDYSTCVSHFLLKAISEISTRVDHYAIACNTLNYFAPKIDALGLRARLISVTDVVAQDIKHRHVKRLALLGAKPVLELDTWSPYGILRDLVHVEIPPNTADLHQLIYDIKIRGGKDPKLAERFAAILDTLESDYVILACTELPLLPVSPQKKRLVDVTHLLAEELVRASMSVEKSPDA